MKTTLRSHSTAITKVIHVFSDDTICQTITTEYEVIDNAFEKTDENTENTY